MPDHKNQPPVWHPTISLANLKKRAEILRKIRRFFEARDVLEVETPQLSRACVSDPDLLSFKTRYGQSPSEIDGGIPYYLATSPEYPMKRLLAAGSGSIFQICKVFRNGERGRLHNPEFTLLEWYRTDMTAKPLMQEVSQLVECILGTPPAGCVEYRTLFLDILNLDPLQVAKKQLLQCAQAHGLVLSRAESLSETHLLQFLFSNLIEPRFAKEKPMFVYRFPAQQAALAALTTEDRRVCERFELYFQGIELANGFLELRDAAEQRERFMADRAIYQARHGAERPIDTLLLQALNAGLPPCAGVALGIDRLLLLALSVAHIRETLSFPFESA